MYKKITLATAAVGAVVALAVVESPALTPFVQALNGAQSLNAEYIVSQVGGTTQRYSIQMAKPDQLRLDTPSQTIVADGKQITFYDKGQNGFYKVDQTKEKLMEVFADDNVAIWKSFYDAKALDYVNSAKNEGTKKRANKTLKVISVNGDAKGDFTMNLYLDPANNLLSQAEINTKNGNTTTTRIITANKVDTSAIGGNVFAFVAPNGAKEMSAADMMTGKWFHSFDEAMKVAKATGKVMMVDFYAVWCGPCKMMDAEVFQSAGFGDKAKDFILVKVDAEQDVANAKKYGVSAYPTVKFINGNGQIVHEFVGYGGPAHVYGEMDKARAKR